MSYGLKELKVVLLDLSFAEMVELSKWQGWSEYIEAKGEMGLPQGLITWAGDFAASEDFDTINVSDNTKMVEAQEQIAEEEAEEEEELKMAPKRDIGHLEVPADAAHMFIGIMCPANMAEEVQRNLPDMPEIQYACDWITKGGLGAPEGMQAIAHDMWEVFVGAAG